jgi:glycosyl transferase family 25
MNDFNGRIFINVINLPFRKDRQHNIMSSMDYQNLEFQFFEGTYGYDISDSDLSYITSKSKQNLSYGSVGCAISHIKLWEYISKQSRDDIFVIFEDDIILPVDFKPNLYELTKKLPSDYDIIFLGSNSTRGRDLSYFIDKKIFKSFNPRRGLYAYLIYPNSAKKLVKLIKPFDLLYGGLDTKIGTLTRKGLLNVYHFFPSIVKVDTGITSNIYNFSLRKSKKVMLELENC